MSRYEDRIFILDDETSHLSHAVDCCTGAGYADEDIIRSTEPNDGLEALERRGSAAVWIVDIKIRGDADAGYHFIKDAVSSGAIWKPAIIVLWSGTMSDTTEFALQHVAPWNIEVVRKTLVGDDFRQLLRRLRENVRSERDSTVIEAQSDQALFYETLPMIAEHPLPVLITGPSGAGKEHVARRLCKLMRESGATANCVRTINCAAFTESLLMTELFGAVAGAYTDLRRHRLGLVLEVSGYRLSGTGSFVESLGLTADNLRTDETGEQYYVSSQIELPGLLVLDEVAGLPLPAQEALLRALENQPIRPQGYDGPGFAPSLQVIAITNRMQVLSDPRLFLPDLLARLSGWPIVVRGIEHPDRTETALGIVNQTLRTIRRRVPPIKAAQQRHVTRTKSRTSAQVGAVSPAVDVPFKQVGDDAVFSALMAALRNAADRGRPAGARGLQWLVRRAAAFALRENRQELNVEDVALSRKYVFVPEDAMVEDLTCDPEFEGRLLKLLQSADPTFVEKQPISRNRADTMLDSLFAAKNANSRQELEKLRAEWTKDDSKLRTMCKYLGLAFQSHAQAIREVQQVILNRRRAASNDAARRNKTN